MNKSGLIAKRDELYRQLKVVNSGLKQMRELEMAPYRKFLEEYSEKLGITVHLKDLKTHRIQKNRIAIVSYLLRNNITVKNPIALSKIRDVIGIGYSDFNSALWYKGLSPSRAGIVEFENRRTDISTIGGLSSRVYITDPEKARIYLTIMRKIPSLRTATYF